VIVERSDETLRGGTVRSWVTTGGSIGEPARYHPDFDPHSATFLQTAERQKVLAGTHRLVSVPTIKEPS
jgi:hypothetical protein